MYVCAGWAIEYCVNIVLEYIVICENGRQKDPETFSCTEKGGDVEEIDEIDET